VDDIIVQEAEVEHPVEDDKSDSEEPEVESKQEFESVDAIIVQERAIENPVADEESVNSQKEDEQMFDQEGEIEKPVEHDSSDDDLPIVESK